MKRRDQAGVYRIVIIGAGFGGLVSLRRLQKLAAKERHVEFVLVNPASYQEVRTEMDMVADLGTPTSFCRLPFLNLLDSKRVRFIRGKMLQLDPHQKELTYQIEGDEQLHNLSYSQILIACGAKAWCPPIENLQEEAYSLWSLKELENFKCALVMRIKEAARYLKGEHADFRGLSFASRQECKDSFKSKDERLVDPKAQACNLKEFAELLSQKVDELLTISIIGAGSTGIELLAPLAISAREYAAELGISPKLLRFQLIDGCKQPLQGFSESLQEAAVRRLKELGIELHLGSFVSKVDESRIYLENSQSLVKGLLAYASGAQVDNEVKAWGLNLSQSGRIMVKPSMQTLDFEDVWAVGDIASYKVQDGVEQHELPMLAQHAMRQAIVAADNIWHAYEVSAKRLKLGSTDCVLEFSSDLFRKARQYKEYDPRLHGQLVSIGEDYALGWVGNKKQELTGKPGLIFKRMTFALYWQTLGGIEFLGRRFIKALGRNS